MRVLLAEDDQLLGDGIQKGLGEFHHAIDWVKDGLAAKQALEMEKFDLVILDLGLPKMSGMEVLRSIRKAGNEIPILILTARDSVDDRVQGLDAGADDYLVKPFDLDELAARVRALHRRRAGTVSNEIAHKGITLNPASHQVTLDKAPVSLPRREFSLLQKLLENRGRVVSRDTLLQSLYGWEDEIDSNTLEVHIHNLRKKFGTDLIRTIRGVGYMIEKDENKDENIDTSDENNDNG
tara:strand:- start:78388 stop:79098 length:711 start_codon:yes stop_codon:yes gene_type:complete